jgi:CheY-like chemotaxis protein
MKLLGTNSDPVLLETRELRARLLARFGDRAGTGMSHILELLAGSASCHAAEVEQELGALAEEAASLELDEIRELARRGEVAARRIPSESTSVVACLRAVRMLARALAELGDGGVSAAPDGSRRSRGRVLVVDDSAITANLVSAVLGDAGFTVQVAANAAGLEQALSGARPDVVLSDVHMPDLDCERVLRRVREVAPGARLLLISADGEPALARECRRVGADGYIARDRGPLAVLARIGAVMAEARR